MQRLHQEQRQVQQICASMMLLMSGGISIIHYELACLHHKREIQQCIRHQIQACLLNSFDEVTRWMTHTLIGVGQTLCKNFSACAE